MEEKHIQTSKHHCRGFLPPSQHGGGEGNWVSGPHSIGNVKTQQQGLPVDNLQDSHGNCCLSWMLFQWYLFTLTFILALILLNITLLSPSIFPLWYSPPWLHLSPSIIPALHCYMCSHLPPPLLPLPVLLPPSFLSLSLPLISLRWTLVLRFQY